MSLFCLIVTCLHAHIPDEKRALVILYLFTRTVAIVV